jgi:hypothetical protein
MKLYQWQGQQYALAAPDAYGPEHAEVNKLDASNDMDVMFCELIDEGSDPESMVISAIWECVERWSSLSEAGHDPTLVSVAIGPDNDSAQVVVHSPLVPSAANAIELALTREGDKEMFEVEIYPKVTRSAFQRYLVFCVARNAMLRALLQAPALHSSRATREGTVSRLPQSLALLARLDGPIVTVQEAALPDASPHHALVRRGNDNVIYVHATGLPQSETIPHGSLDFEHTRFVEIAPGTDWETVDALLCSHLHELFTELQG